MKEMEKCRNCMKMTCKGCKRELGNSYPEYATLHGLNQFPKVKDLEGKFSRTKEKR